MNENYREYIDSLVLWVGLSGDRFSMCENVIEQCGFWTLEVKFLNDIDSNIRNIDVPLAVVVDPRDIESTLADIKQFRRNHPETKILFIGNEFETATESLIREMGVAFLGSREFFLKHCRAIIQKILRLGRQRYFHDHSANYKG